MVISTVVSSFPRAPAGPLPTAKAADAALRNLNRAWKKQCLRLAWVPLRERNAWKELDVRRRRRGPSLQPSDAFWRRVLLECLSRRSRRFVHRGPPSGFLALLLTPRDSDFERGHRGSNHTARAVSAISHRGDSTELRKTYFCRSHFSEHRQKSRVNTVSLLLYRGGKNVSGDGFVWSEWGTTHSGAESLSPFVHRKSARAAPARADVAGAVEPTRWLPLPLVLHPHPRERFRTRYPRWKQRRTRRAAKIRSSISWRAAAMLKEALFVGRWRGPKSSARRHSIHLRRSPS